MDVLELIGFCMVITQFVKKTALVVFRVKLEGRAAIIVSVLVSAALVVFAALEMGLPIGFGLVMPFIKIAIGSNMSYSLIKVARNQ